MSFKIAECDFYDKQTKIFSWILLLRGLSVNPEEKKVSKGNFDVDVFQFLCLLKSLSNSHKITLKFS